MFQLGVVDEATNPNAQGLVASSTTGGLVSHVRIIARQVVRQRLFRVGCFSRFVRSESQAVGAEHQQRIRLQIGKPMLTGVNPPPMKLECHRDVTDLRSECCFRGHHRSPDVTDSGILFEVVNPLIDFLWSEVDGGGGK